ncbi:intradiol ring-cleavage dioxygenase [Streptacidiphilus sp. EB103A]|uniref:intradiol ring-cleavage dioxygenase n=1 Tax=Streptacidiphilus sp. EB103A TaxID=3156275 RepID=UPI003516731C
MTNHTKNGISEIPEELDNHAISRLLVSRRRLLGVSGVGLAAVGLGIAGCGKSTGTTAAASASASVSPATAALLTVEEMEGPYYLDYELFRQNITEGKQGIPLSLQLDVIDALTGKALSGAAVEVWQCDSMGVYSGYTKNGSSYGNLPSGMPSTMPSVMPSGGFGSLGGHQKATDKLTYLRGSQMSDSTGRVRFQTIFPGWYSGRALHIHTKVHVSGRHTATGYTGGHVCHTGQLFFAETTADKVQGLPQYVKNKATRTLLDQDHIYQAAGSGTRAGLLDLRQVDDNDVSKGIVASLSLGVDQSRTHTGE